MTVEEKFAIYELLREVQAESLRARREVTEWWKR